MTYPSILCVVTRPWWPVLCGTFLSLGLPVGLAAQSGAPAAPASTNSAPALVVIPPSVFDPKVRRDPFFPDSERLNPKPVKVAEANPGMVKAAKPKEPAEFLKLMGITGSAKRRFAILNGVTFGLQEEAVIKTTSGDYRVKVVAIRSRSVVVKIEPSAETTEIYLKED